MRKILFLCALCASVLTAYAVDGELSGRFTINSKGDQVSFSQGNLHYHCKDNMWSFGYPQYYVIGSDNSKVAPDYDGAIDIFCWGTGDNPTLFSDESVDYLKFTDWGTNAIENGGQTADYWRTMTADEWEYLLTKRPNATKLVAFGTVNAVNGIFILPDDWTPPFGYAEVKSAEDIYLGETSTSYKDPDNNKNHFEDNTFTHDQWQSDMEPAGAVFLPAAGWFDSSIRSVYATGAYWSSTGSEAYATCLWFQSFYLFPHMGAQTKQGACVRLVHDLETNSAVDNINAISESYVKRVVNGQLFILRDGKTYNLLGAEVR